MAHPGQSEAKRRGKFEQERQILRMLKTFQHSQNDHVVTHHAAWTHQGSFYILFPLATCNLKRYMEVLPRQNGLPNCKVQVIMPYTEVTQTPILNKKFTLWLLTQFLGLAQGVQRVHNLARLSDSRGLSPPTSSTPDATGYHHDLKPDNILVFVNENERNDYGTFKIGDFGSGRAEMLTRSGAYKSFRKTHDARVSPLATEKPNGAPTYTAPDHYLTGKMSRAADMWSLGCVFLEILTWAFLPFRNNPRSFSSDRHAENLCQSGQDESQLIDDRFWCAKSSEQTHGIPNSTGKRSAAINAAVLKQLAALEEIHPEGHGQFISLFGTVVMCTKRMLVVDRAHRIDGQTLERALVAALLKAKSLLESKEDTDSCHPWQEPAVGSGQYVKSFPTPTTAPADAADLSDLAHSSTGGNLLSPESSYTSPREPSAAVVHLAGEMMNDQRQGSVVLDDQQNEDKLGLGPEAADTLKPATDENLILGSSRYFPDHSSTPGPSLQTQT